MYSNMESNIMRKTSAKHVSNYSTNGQRISTKGRIAYRAVIED